MKVTLEHSDLLTVLEKVLGRSLTAENVGVIADPFSVEITDLTINDLIKVNATLEDTSTKPAVMPEQAAGTAADTGPVTAEEMARIAEQNRVLAGAGGGAGPVPDGPNDIPEDFLPPGGSFDSPPPTDNTGK